MYQVKHIILMLVNRAGLGTYIFLNLGFIFSLQCRIAYCDPAWNTARMQRLQQSPAAHGSCSKAKQTFARDGLLTDQGSLVARCCTTTSASLANRQKTVHVLGHVLWLIWCCGHVLLCIHARVFVYNIYIKYFFAVHTVPLFKYSCLKKLQKIYIYCLYFIVCKLMYISQKLIPVSWSAKYNYSHFTSLKDTHYLIWLQPCKKYVNEHSKLSVRLDCILWLTMKKPLCVQRSKGQQQIGKIKSFSSGSGRS